MEQKILENVQKYKNYRALDTSLNCMIALMRDIFGDDYESWEDEVAKEVYTDLLDTIQKVWKEKRKLKEGE